MLKFSIAEKIFSKGVFIKLWPLIFPKVGIMTTKKSECFDA